MSGAEGNVKIGVKKLIPEVGIYVEYNQRHRTWSRGNGNEL